ncbi:MAG: hypothetical protein WD358_02405 [Nitriliruptoraceae bacterium]
MNTRRRITIIVSATLLSLALLAGPAIASGAVLAAESGDHRVVLAETPRDRLGLLLWGALIVGTGAAIVNARKQLKGERDQTSGEFRWR